MMEQIQSPIPERDGWRNQQERLRFEVLQLLYQGGGAQPGRAVDARGFAGRLGVEEDDVWNALVWLEHADFVGIHSTSPVISITEGGVHFLEHEAQRRRTIRGISPPGHPGA